MDCRTQHHCVCVCAHTWCDMTVFSACVPVLQVWNLENMLPIQCLQRHENCVNALAMWKDTLYSGSEDTEIKVGCSAHGAPG